MMKAHSHWRDYCVEKISEADFGVSDNNVYKKEIITKNIEKIGEKIKKKQVFTKLTQLENQLRVKKQKAREIVFPDNNFNETMSVKNWFNSDEANEEEKACMKIYERCLSGAKIGPRQFLRFSNYARFTLMLEDRNRRLVYSFSNREFAERAPKWLPQSNKDDTDLFEVLPDDWNADAPPVNGKEPSNWVVQVAGDTRGLKDGRPASVILTQRSNEMCLKYQDIKREVVEDVQDSQQFFCNIDGKPLAPIQKNKGVFA